MLYATAYMEPQLADKRIAYKLDVPQGICHNTKFLKAHFLHMNFHFHWYRLVENSVNGLDETT